MGIAWCKGTDLQMRMSLKIALGLALCLVAYAWQGMPRMFSVDPMSGKVGDVITVTGENLGKDQVAKVFLTDGKNDFPVEVTEQTATTMKIKVPEKVSGKLALEIQPVGKELRLIEQPVKFTVE
jgi:hypothetical protein